MISPTMPRRSFDVVRLTRPTARRVGRALWVMALFGCCTGLRAELQWKETTVILEPPAGAHEAVAMFEFKNLGAGLVRIIEVQSGCGCTAAVVDDASVQPGESGQIAARYHSDGKHGRQTVALTVVTDEAPGRSYPLTLEVRLKESASVSPMSQIWRVGEDVTAKVFTVSLAPGFRFVGAESTSRDFAIEVLPGAEGRAQFQVTPRDLWAKRSAAIKVKVAGEGGAVVESVAIVRIQ